MISDNLGPLFKKEAPGVRFRQGTVLTWDSDTGANTIDLAGATLTNVPILNTGEATALKAGHVVGMLGQGSAWFIIGRVTPPNSADFAGASVAFDTAHNSATNFSVGNTHSTVVSATLDVPAWADEALVTVIATMSLLNVNDESIANYYVLMQPFIGTEEGGGVGFGLSPLGDTSKNDLNCGTVSYSVLVTDPGSTIDVHLEAWTNDVGDVVSASVTNTAIIDATAIFRSTV